MQPLPSVYLLGSNLSHEQRDTYQEAQDRRPPDGSALRPPRLANVDFVENRETQRVMALPDQALPLVVYEAHLTELHDRMMEVMSVAGVVN